MDALDIISPEEMIRIADDRGRAFKPIKTNQIRNFYSAVISIKNKVQLLGKDFKFTDIKTELLLLKPKLAYAAGRHAEVKAFKEFMDEAIDSILKSSDKEAATNNFFSLLESVVAYHKFYGGKDN